MKIATGFDFEPQPDGTVLIEFFDNGATFNRQVVTQAVFANMPVVSVLTSIALMKGPTTAQRIMDILSEPDVG